MALSGYDYFVVLLYLVGVLLIGAFFKKYVKSSSDFFLAGRSLPFWAIGMSIVVSDIGALDFVGVTGQAYRYGMVIANFDWIGSVPAMLLAAFVFVPYYWRAGVYTIPEYLGRRYNDAVRTMMAAIWVIFMAFNLGVVLWATGILLNTMMGWSIETCILVTAVIVGVYTVSGGLSAVVMTDVVQMVIMFIGGGAVAFLGIWKIGGWGNMVEHIHGLGSEFVNHFELVRGTNENTPYPWTGILFGLAYVLAPAYFIGNQTIVQRCLGAKDEWHAKASLIWGAALKVAIPVFIVFPGLIALGIADLPPIEDGDKVFPMMIKHLLPPGLTGLVFAAFFAGLMSSVDSMLNAAATIWTKDVYQLFIKREAPDSHYLVVGRIVTVIILIVGILTAPLNQRFPGVYVYIQTLLSFFQGPTLAILVLGMFSKRINRWGGLVGLLAGLGISGSLFAFKASIFTIEDPFLYISWWSFIGSVIVTIAVSLATQPETEEKLAGLIYRPARASQG